MRQILLLSNSTMHGGRYLEWPRSQLEELFDDGPEVVFVPYARPGGISHDEYTEHASMEEKAERILDAAFSVFSQRGYRQAGVDEVATWMADRLAALGASIDRRPTSEKETENKRIILHPTKKIGPDQIIPLDDDNFKDF